MFKSTTTRFYQIIKAWQKLFFHQFLRWLFWNAASTTSTWWTNVIWKIIKKMRNKGQTKASRFYDEFSYIYYATTYDTQGKLVCNVQFRPLSLWLAQVWLAQDKTCDIWSNFKTFLQYSTPSNLSAPWRTIVRGDIRYDILTNKTSYSSKKFQIQIILSRRKRNH